MKHPATAALLEFWTELRAGRPAPFKAEVTAQALGGSIASHVFFIEAVGDSEMRIRLAGRMTHTIFGMDLRGISATAIMEGESRARFIALAAEALASGGVGLAQGVLIGGPGASTGVEIILAPLKNDFGRIDRLLCAAHATGEDNAPVELEPAARRCRLTQTQVIGAAVSKVSAPLAGFAEAPAGFLHQNPALTGLSGDSAGGGARRRDHLKLVKD
ncbi:MAG: PAS domain-containing protein [Paracoccaceae bacterium]